MTKWLPKLRPILRAKKNHSTKRHRKVRELIEWCVKTYNFHQYLFCRLLSRPPVMQHNYASVFPVFKILLIGNSRYGLQLLLRTLFYGFNRVETDTPKRQFYFWGQKQVTRGQIWWIQWLIDGICCVFSLKFGHNCRSMRWRVIVQWNPQIVLRQKLPFCDTFFYANASIPPNNIIYWPSVPLKRIYDAPNFEYRREEWASPWLLGNFGVVFSVSTRLLSSILMTADLFACWTRWSMSHHKLWCVPWMRD